MLFIAAKNGGMASIETEAVISMALYFQFELLVERIFLCMDKIRNLVMPAGMRSFENFKEGIEMTTAEVTAPNAENCGASLLTANLISIVNSSNLVVETTTQVLFCKTRVIF